MGRFLWMYVGSCMLCWMLYDKFLEIWIDFAKENDGGNYLSLRSSLSS